MLSLIGFSVVITVVALLLSKRMTPLIALTLVPLLGAIIAGFTPEEISVFFQQGLQKVTPVAVMFIFAILYFGVMQEVGLFSPLINRIIRVSRGDFVAISIGTVCIASIAHLDGSGASTFLITIPALLPLYQRVQMSPYLLLLLVGASASVMNMLPWAGPLGRVATVLETDPTLLWRPLIPLQCIALVLLVILAVILGKREQRRTGQRERLNAAVLSEIPALSESAKLEEPPELNKTWGINMALTSILVVALVYGLLPSALLFMVATCFALLINFPAMPQQLEQIKRHAPPALAMALILLSAGVFLGVLKGSGMLNALAVSFIGLLPDFAQPSLHLIIGFLGVPFELVLNTDAYYFALLPIVEQIVVPHGPSPESVAYAMTIGNIIGTFISPFSPALWLALGLADLEMGAHIKYSLGWIWGLSVVLLSISMLMGII
jgi:citrate-Mg2+:H+ or citrate-Ca2+:H+ symporter, CitMHS family